MRLAGIVLTALVCLFPGCGSVQLDETPPESPDVRSARLAARGDSLASLGLYRRAADSMACAAMLLPRGSPERNVLARRAASLSPGPSQLAAMLLLENPDSLAVFQAIRLGGAGAVGELTTLILTRATPHWEYASLAAGEALVEAGDPAGAAVFLANCPDSLPGAAGRDHLVLSYRSALGAGDIEAQERLWRRAESMDDPELMSLLLHHRGMFRRENGLPGWCPDLLASLALWPAGDVHARGYAALRDTLLADPSLASSAASDYYAGGMWNQLYDLAVSSPEPPADLYYLAARTRDRLGMYREAAEMLEEYLRRWPSGADAPDAAINRARSLGAMGMTGEAVEILEYYGRTWPSHARISNLPWYIGSLLAENGDWEGALPYFRETLSRYPGNTTADDAHFHLCLGLMKTGDPSASAEFARLVSRWPESVYSPPARYWHGRLLLESGDTEGERVLTSLISDKPESLPAAFAREYLGLPPWEPVYTMEPLDRWMTRNERPPADPPESAVTGAFLADAGRREWALDLFRTAEAQVGGAFRLGPFYADRGIWERGPWAAYTMWSLEGSVRPLELWRLRYPQAWEPLVRSACGRYGLDPRFIWSIMKQESGFSHRVYSSAGARGLLQMIPSTSEYVAGRMGWEGFTPDDLYLPAVSIEYGTACIADYRTEIGGGLYETLAAYNGGPHNAVRWGAGRASPEEFYSRITYNETKKYVEIVSHNFAVYRAIWP